MAADDVRDRTWLSQQPLARALVDSARADEAPEDLGTRLAARLCAELETATFAGAHEQLGPAAAAPVLEANVTAIARRWRFWIGLGAAAAVTVAALVSWRGDRVALAPDSARVRTMPPPALAAPLAPPKPCDKPLRVTAAQALIDDFEDGNSRLFAHAGRSGTWRLVVGGKSGDAVERVTPELIETGARRQRALRVAVPVVGGWGASLVTSFGRCQDASAFAGIRFRAKGPAPLRVIVNMVEVVDQRHGGTCAEDCYHAHAREVVTGERFATYTVLFDQLEQPGETPAKRRLPFRAESLHGIAFGVAPHDAAREFWVDDIEFVAREQ